ncbi:hypothetical protein CUMW_218420, partial [Citrus unshiu]
DGDKTFEHPYLQAIGSHTNYWRDEDTALFILKHLYRDIPEDPNSAIESGGDNSKGESGSTVTMSWHVQVHIDSHGWKIAGVIEVK